MTWALVISLAACVPARTPRGMEIAAAAVAGTLGGGGALRGGPGLMLVGRGAIGDFRLSAGLSMAFHTWREVGVRTTVFTPSVEGSLGWTASLGAGPRLSLSAGGGWMWRAVRIEVAGLESRSAAGAPFALMEARLWWPVSDRLGVIFGLRFRMRAGWLEPALGLGVGWWPGSGRVNPGHDGTSKRRRRSQERPARDSNHSGNAGFPRQSGIVRRARSEAGGVRIEAGNRRDSETEERVPSCEAAPTD